MGKWQQREQKRSKHIKSPKIKTGDIAHKDKIHRRKIREAQKEKEDSWEQLETEGDMYWMMIFR